LIKDYDLPKKDEEKKETNDETADVDKPTEPKEPTEPTQTDKKETGKGCNNDEILAILAHELGHWKLNHNLKNLILNEVCFVPFCYFL
jgi:STE24 endopeptidase